MFENAISSIPRMRAWRFSSVTSGLRPAKSGASAVRYAWKIGSMATAWNRTPSRFASVSASSLLIDAVYRDGIAMVVTFCAPSARAASTAVSAESIPPESPSTALLNPVFSV